MSRWALEAMQPSVQWELGFFPQGELLSCRADCSPPSSAKVKSDWSYTAASHMYIHSMGKDTYVVFVLLGDSPLSEFYMPTFRNTLSVPSS
jgi:hypothetical protein